MGSVGRISLKANFAGIESCDMGGLRFFTLLAMAGFLELDKNTDDMSLRN